MGPPLGGDRALGRRPPRRLPYGGPLHPQHHLQPVHERDAGSQSQQAQDLLSAAHPQNSTLYVVLERPSLTGPGLCRALFGFQTNLSRANVTDLAGSTSVCSLYAGFLDREISPDRALINSTAQAVQTEANGIYDFPAAFLENWTAVGVT